MMDATVFSNISYRCRYMWRRNIDVGLVNWKTNVLPPLVEPVLYILAFGVGLGAYVQQMSYAGRLYDYIAFMAPGMVAVGVMFHSIFDTMYGAFVRMRYQKTFDAIITTPLSVEDILAGEILSGATRGVFAGLSILLIISLFGLASYPASLLVVPPAALAGLLFAGLGLWFAALAPYIDTLNLPVFLFVNPMFLFSGTFFPLDGMSSWIRWLAQALPLTHLVNICRAATLGRPAAALWTDYAYLAAAAMLACYAGIAAMRGRLVK